CSRALDRAGRSIARRMAIIPMTTSNSTSVKARCPDMKCCFNLRSENMAILSRNLVVERSSTAAPTHRGCAAGESEKRDTARLGNDSAESLCCTGAVVGREDVEVDGIDDAIVIEVGRNVACWPVGGSRFVEVRRQQAEVSSINLSVMVGVTQNRADDSS